MLSPDPSPGSPALTTTTNGPSSVQNEMDCCQQPLTPSPTLSRQLSLKSDVSYDAGLRQPGILNILSYEESDKDCQGSYGIREATQGISDCSLARSSSRATDISAHSRHTMRSTKSAHSVQVLGSYPLGSLRVHSGDLPEGHTSPQCLQGGDVMIVTDVPTGSFFGYDTIGFNIGRNGRFEGIREMPPGPHFIYGGSTSEISTRNGFWVMSKQRASGEPGDIFVKRWDKYTETLEEEVSAAEVRIQKENVPSAYNTLMPYNVRAGSTSGLPQSKITSTGNAVHADGSETWHSLTFAIKGAMLSRITGREWNEWKVSSTDDCKPMVSKAIDCKTHTRMDLASERVDAIRGKERALTFVFPRGSKIFSDAVVGRARSEQAMDSTSHIRAVIADRCTFEDPDEVIGELQFCYLTGVLLGNISCMEQWAHVVKILFKAYQFAVEEPSFFAKILESFHAQLIYDDECLQGSIFDHSHYLQDELKTILTIFKSRLTEQLLAKGDALRDEEIELGKSFERLEAWLWKWGWDLRGNYVRAGKIQLEDGEYVDAEMGELEGEDERGEYAPVVVELDADGREKGIVRWE